MPCWSSSISMTTKAFLDHKQPQQKNLSDSPALNPHGVPVMRPVNRQQSVKQTCKSMRPGVRWTGEAADLPDRSYPVPGGYKWTPRNPPLWTGGGDPGPHPDGSQASSGSWGRAANIKVQDGTPPKMADATCTQTPDREIHETHQRLEAIFDAIWRQLESMLNPPAPPSDLQQTPQAQHS
ncbi:Hypothetical predicted protein [Pelobates cultripes]|uniref:Uncharacterized protein n=1 Tax=Pelobates cultripes TaxID=61616 RepID=A0AAD1SB95_PELCU|nr:Hypothetical predicted protein [Pelobates cultripes]